VGAEALLAAEPTAAPADGNVAAVSHGQHVPRPPLQPLDAPTRREQSGLVTLTF